MAKTMEFFQAIKSTEAALVMGGASLKNKWEGGKDTGIPSHIAFDIALPGAGICSVQFPPRAGLLDELNHVLAVGSAVNLETMGNLETFTVGINSKSNELTFKIGMSEFPVSKKEPTKS